MVDPLSSVVLAFMERCGDLRDGEVDETQSSQSPDRSSRPTSKERNCPGATDISLNPVSVSLRKGA
jgi:hypothetical protein